MKIFTEMLFADQLRGADGTGIIYNKNKEIKTLKSVMASGEFISTKEYDAATRDCVLSGNFVVGHNRAATKGKLTHENTHPFREKHITLVHNGTLPYHKNLADVEVDSQAICVSMAEIGYKKTIEKINGAFALIWVDNKQKTLNFVRNNQRPLWHIETDWLHIFVSEPKLALWICDRNNITVSSYKQLPVNVLHQFNLGEWKTFHTEDVKVYVTPQHINHGYTTQNNHKPNVYTLPAPQTGTYVTTNPSLQESIKFIPISVDKDIKSKLIGEWEDDKTGETIEVRYWTANEATATALLKEGKPLIGKISHIAIMPDKGSRYFIVSSAYIAADVESKMEYKSHNGLTLTAKDIAKVEEKCSICNAKHTQQFLRDNIKNVNIHLMKQSVEYTCPDCVVWESQWGDSYAEASAKHYGV
jgi:predicted glutamine amidotransferase